MTILRRFFDWLRKLFDTETKSTIVILTSAQEVILMIYGFIVFICYVKKIDFHFPMYLGLFFYLLFYLHRYTKRGWEEELEEIMRKIEWRIRRTKLEGLPKFSWSELETILRMGIKRSDFLREKINFSDTKEEN